MKEAVKKVDRKGFASSSSGSYGSESEAGEEGEQEMEDYQFEKDDAQVEISAMGESGEEEEMRESDMDEFSFEENGESYIEMPSDEEEEVPNLIPAPKKAIKKSADIIEFQPESSEDEVEEKSDYSDIPTSELDEYSEENEEDNPHGFMYASKLDTYKKNKRERLEQQQIDGKSKYEGKKRDHKSKNAGTTNYQKTRSKPFNMLLPKRISEQNVARDELRGKLKRKNVSAIKQTGHYNKNTAQRIESKKKNLGKW